MVGAYGARCDMDEEISFRPSSNAPEVAFGRVLGACLRTPPPGAKANTQTFARVDMIGPGSENREPAPRSALFPTGGRPIRRRQPHCRFSQTVSYEIVKNLAATGWSPAGAEARGLVSIAVEGLVKPPPSQPVVRLGPAPLAPAGWSRASQALSRAYFWEPHI